MSRYRQSSCRWHCADRYHRERSDRRDSLARARHQHHERATARRHADNDDDAGANDLRWHDDLQHNENARFQRNKHHLRSWRLTSNQKKFTPTFCYVFFFCVVRCAQVSRVIEMLANEAFIIHSL